MKKQDNSYWWGVAGIVVGGLGWWMGSAMSHEKPEYVSSYDPNQVVEVEEVWAENPIEEFSRESRFRVEKEFASSAEEKLLVLMRFHKPHLNIGGFRDVAEGRSYKLAGDSKIFCGDLWVEGRPYQTVKFAYSTYGTGSLAVEGEDGLDVLNWAIVEDAMCY